MKGIESLLSIAPSIIIASVGGVANYIYKSSKGEKFKLHMLLANMFLAGRLGFVVQGFIPADSTMFGPLMAITGFSAYPILQWLETHGRDFITKLLK